MLTLTLTSHLKQNYNLREGKVGSFPEPKLIQIYYLKRSLSHANFNLNKRILIQQPFLHWVHSFHLFFFIQSFSPPCSLSAVDYEKLNGSLTSLKNLFCRPHCSEHLLWKASSTELVDVCCEWC